MPDPFKVTKKNEYFISIAQKSEHTFIMLGVVDNEGYPRLLARVGKTNSIDPDYKSIKMPAKLIVSTSLARIANEGISRKSHYEEEISHLTYSINYEQTKEFLSILAAIEKKQIEDTNISTGIIRLYGEEGLKKRAIRCYLPTENLNDEVTFEYEELNEFVTRDNVTIRETNQKLAGIKIGTPNLADLEKGSNEIHIMNTCRTTAIHLVEALLGFATKVSKLYFIVPGYQTKLIGGQPDKQSFYILPPPPLVKKERFTKEQYKVLEKFHKKLEDLAKSDPENPQTRAKFDALKEKYNSIFGENDLKIDALLTKLNQHAEGQQEALFQKRSPSVVSKILGLHSSTQRMFKSINKELEESKVKQDKKEVPPSLK